MFKCVCWGVFKEFLVVARVFICGCLGVARIFCVVDRLLLLYLVTRILLGCSWWLSELSMRLLCCC